MNVELSRRAGAVMAVPPLTDLSWEDREKFIEAVMQARNFAALPARWRQLIEAAEAFLAQVK